MTVVTYPVPTLIGQQYPYSVLNPLGIKNWTNYVSFGTTTSGVGGLSSNSSGTRIIYGGGYYAFGDSGGYVYYSTDAKTWSYASAAGAAIQGIAYNGTNWCIVTSSNTIYTATSPNGTWTSRTSPFQATNSINDIRWIPQVSLFIASAQTSATPWTGIASSPDGVTWTARYQLPASASQYYNIGLDDTTGTPTIAVASGQATAANVIYSTNGTTWTATDSNGSNNAVDGLQFIRGLNRWVASPSAYAQTSGAIGTTWSTVTAATFNTFRTNSVISGGAQVLGRDEWNYDSINNLYYVLMFPYSSGNGNSYNNTQLFTFDPSKVFTSFFNTGSTINYAMTLVKTENLPMNSYGRNGPTGNSPNYGYANGIHIYSSINQYDSSRQIWTTA